MMKLIEIRGKKLKYGEETEIRGKTEIPGKKLKCREKKLKYGEETDIQEKKLKYMERN